MKHRDKAARIGAILDERYPEPPAPLVGARQDAYQLLLKVLLSAQCTDARVNQVAPELFAAAATPQAMVELPVAHIQALIRPCGLAPAKAKAIHGLSTRLLEHHQGAVPASFEALEALPGVGHKTASVVMGQAFGVPAFPVDTHIHRLAGRWGLSRARNVAETERDLKRLYPPEDWHRKHLQFIYFGREHCPARAHAPQACPICAWAASRRRLRAEATARRKTPRHGATR